jgi:hypothetical protein
VGEDAADRCLADLEALLAELHDDLGSAPHGLVEAQVLDGLHERRGPFGFAGCLRPLRLRLRLRLPAIELGEGVADGTGSVPDREPIADGLAPARDRVPSSRRFEIWGLRAEKTGRSGSGSDKMTGQTTNLHGDLRVLRFADPSLGDLLIRPTGAFSYVFERGHNRRY